MNQFFSSYEDIFALGGEPTDKIDYHIETLNNRPIAVSPYLLSEKKRDLLKSELDKMLLEDVIEECESLWAAPVVLISKSDGSMRFCVDYRKLNAITVSDRYPMPKIDDLLHLAKRTLFVFY